MIQNLFENSEKEDITEIVLVLDKSGSMENIRYITIDSFNAFVKEQKAVAGQAYFTLLTFNENLTLVEDATPIQNVRNLDHSSYETDGSTALLDAIGQQIINTNRRLASMPDSRRPSKVVFVILTDGQENASHSFSVNDVKELISEHERVFKWDFLFLGANQDAFGVGKQYGVKPGKALSFSASADGLKGVVSAASRSIASYRTSGAPEGDKFFTDEEHQYQRNLGAAAAPTGR
jgi:uncharacterized protein YegL